MLENHKLRKDIYIYHNDCIETLKELINENVKVDAIITDPPFGTTVCVWDEIIPFDVMWNLLKQIVKEHSAIVLFGSQPFTSKLICSNIKNFKYEWIWQKAVGSNFATLKYQPMKEHENICVFSYETHNYYPQMQKRSLSGMNRLNYGHSGSTSGDTSANLKFDGFTPDTYDKEMRNPSSVQYFNNREKDRGLHPTQKPIALLEYLIKTYTKEEELVLDFTMGSGSTGIACINTNRKFIGIEKDEKYFNVAKDRLERYLVSQKLF